MDAMEFLLALGTAGVGFVVADGVDRFLATYNPDPAKADKIPKDVFTSSGNGTLGNTLNVANMPNWKRWAAGGALTVVPAVGAAYVRRSPMAKSALEGLAFGAGINVLKLAFNNVLMPLLIGKDKTDTGSIQKSFVARLYPAEVAAHINSVQKAPAPGALSGARDVGPFALASDSPYPDAVQALRRRAGVQDEPYPDVRSVLGGPSQYPDAAEVLRRRSGVGYEPGPPPEGGTGPHADPHTDPACGCIGDDPAIGFAGIANKMEDSDSFNMTP
jgi:hypothetical protein